jgi:hypothetical protein
MNNIMEKKETALVIGIIAAFLAIVIIVMISPRGEPNEEDNDFFPIWLIPIWFVVILPTIQKDKEVKKDDRTFLKIALIGLTLGIALFLFFLLT